MKKYVITNEQYNRWVATEMIDEEAIEWIAYKIVKGMELTNVESSIQVGSRAWVDIYVIEWERKLDI